MDAMVHSHPWLVRYEIGQPQGQAWRGLAVHGIIKAVAR
jgi:hypothetical protein